MSLGNGRVKVEEPRERVGVVAIPEGEPVKRVLIREVVFDGDRSNAIDEKMRGESRPAVGDSGEREVSSILQDS